MYNRYYREELAFMRELGREFAAAHPDAAHFLGERGSDPDVERLLEGFAFLTGRLRQKLDDELPELTHSLMGLLWPHYLRPIPSMTMVQFAALPGIMRERRIVARGVELDSVPVEGTACRFRTTAEAVLDPLEVQHASFDLTPGGGSVLSITLATTAGVKLSQLRLPDLKLHLAGEPASVSTLYLLLSRSLRGVTLQSMAGGRPLTTANLPGGAVTLGGFSDEEALLPYPPNSFPGYRLLQEYFTLPAKFDFVKIEQLGVLAGLGGDTQFVLLFHFSTQPASVLRVAPENFKLACVPAVNLFARDGVPIQVDHDKTEYLVRAEGSDPNHYEIFSIDSVTGFAQGTADRRAYPAFFSFLHAGRGVGDAGSLYHHVRLKPAVVGDGTESYLSFFSASGRSLPPPSETISVKLTCTNRRLPRALRVGDISVATSTSPEFARFRNITGVTGSVAPPLGGELEWRLISHLSLNYLSLTGPEALRSLLGLYNFQALYDQKAARANELRLEAIQAVSSEPEDIIFQGAPLRGIHTTIELAEEKFGGEGDMILFANVLHEFMALYASINSFSRLTVKGARSGEIYQWPPQLGRQPIL